MVPPLFTKRDLAQNIRMTTTMLPVEEAAEVHPWDAVPAYAVTVEQYRTFRRDGYLIVRGLVLPEHVDELRAHTEDLLDEKFDVTPWVHAKGGEEPESRLQMLHRIHMGHLSIPLWERYLLYPRVLDVVQALTGPDVLAMQTMLFMKGPGSNGQGFHQDSYYIPTFPDSLLGAWIAIDRADTENGCLWMSPGANAEPIYPPKHGYGYGDIQLDGIEYVQGVGGHSNDDNDPNNTLKLIADGYGAREVPAVMEPGDVAFFGGHIFHRSLKNRSETRMRRSFVNHYCNARSFTSWGGGNEALILARGNTHMPYAMPKFGTPCAALNPQGSVSDSGFVPEMMMATPGGVMAPQEPNLEPHDHE
jgi:chlorinating enzyme